MSRLTNLSVLERAISVSEQKESYNLLL